MNVLRRHLLILLEGVSVSVCLFLSLFPPQVIGFPGDCSDSIQTLSSREMDCVFSLACEIIHFFCSFAFETRFLLWIRRLLTCLSQSLGLFESLFDPSIIT